MALTVTENSVRQINAALLSLEKKIGETNSEKAQDKQVVQMEFKNVQYDFMAPLKQDGTSVGINTTGVWEGTARTATSAENALIAENATTAETANKATTATTAETANKVKNALTVNGKTYDGSSAVNAGVQTVENGGTGQTTANNALNSFINSLSIGGDAPVDNDYFISQYVNGGTTSTSYHRRPFSKLWEYIKGKISSVLGLTATNYGGKANTAGTADDAYTAGTARSADIKRTLDAVDGDELQIGDGAKVHIVNTVHAKNADSANITKTEDTVNGDTLKIGNGTAATITNAKHAATSDKATKDGKGNNIVDTYATKTELGKTNIPLYDSRNAGQYLTVNSKGTGLFWCRYPSLTFSDFKTIAFNFTAFQQVTIKLSAFGPNVNENNVLSFMVIYWSGVPIIAQGDFAKSQDTGSSGLKCVLNPLKSGTGWCVIRCAYLV